MTHSQYFSIISALQTSRKDASGWSAKSLVLLALLHHWRREAPTDRVVVVSAWAGNALETRRKRSVFFSMFFQRVFMKKGCELDGYFMIFTDFTPK
jgi:hypothetical protein